MSAPRQSEEAKDEIITTVSRLDNCDWLLAFEALELAQNRTLDPEIVQSLEQRLANETGNEATLIREGYKRLQI